jgi:hypothetical protein
MKRLGGENGRVGHRNGSVGRVGIALSGCEKV